MRTATSGLELLAPRSLEEALEFMRRPSPPVPIAGCTDVYVGLNAGAVRERTFLDLWSLDELRGIEERGGLLVIGALATYTQLLRSRLVHRRLPMLAAASREVGGVQIQNRGTIGGNIANASPAGDTLPVLAAAEAVVVLASLDGERRVPFSFFHTGYKRTARRPDELITAVEIPRVEGRQWFRKVGTRAAQAISKVVMAGVRSERPRVAAGSVAPTVIRLPRTEQALAAGDLEGAKRAILEEIRPIDDVRSTAEYRRRVCANLLARFWKDTS